MDTALANQRENVVKPDAVERVREGRGRLGQGRVRAVCRASKDSLEFNKQTRRGLRGLVHFSLKELLKRVPRQGVLASITFREPSPGEPAPWWVSEGQSAGMVSCPGSLGAPGKWRRVHSAA